MLVITIVFKGVNEKQAILMINQCILWYYSSTLANWVRFQQNDRLQKVDPLSLAPHTTSHPRVRKTSLLTVYPIRLMVYLIKRQGVGVDAWMKLEAHSAKQLPPVGSLHYSRLNRLTCCSAVWRQPHPLPSIFNTLRALNGTPVSWRIRWNNKCAVIAGEWGFCASLPIHESDTNFRGLHLFLSQCIFNVN